jgi:hypothetical protein
MATPRLPQNEYQEKLLASFVNASSAATFVRRFFKATRPTRVRRALYNNPTGLALDASNGFALSVKRVGPSDLLSFTAFTFTTTHGSEQVDKVAHGLLTGDGPVRLTNSGGALPAGYATATDYYIIKTSADALQLAATRQLAYIGTPVAISGNGTGTHTLTGVAATCARPVTVADGIDTTSAALVGDKPVALTLSATATRLILAADDELLLVGLLTGTATLPIGEGYAELIET